MSIDYAQCALMQAISTNIEQSQCLLKESLLMKLSNPRDEETTKYSPKVMGEKNQRKQH